MREYKLSVEMDRMPAVNATEQEQQLDLNRDRKLLAHLVRGRACGCKNCIGDALDARWNLRGEELPMGADGQPATPFRMKKT